MAGTRCRPSHMCNLDQVNSQGLWVVLVHAQFVVNIVLPHAVRLVSEPDGSLWLTELHYSVYTQCVHNGVGDKWLLSFPVSIRIYI